MAKPQRPGTLRVRRPRKPHLPPTLLDISLSGTAPLVGQSSNWVVTARYSGPSFVDVTAGSTLASTNNSIATWTAQGRLSALAAGPVTITAGYAGQTVSQDLIIQNAPPPPPPPPPITLISLTLTALTSVPSIGGLQNYKVTGLFSDNNSQDLTSQVTYISSVPAVAAWLSNGVLQALSGGTTVLTARFQGQDSNPITINIASPPPPPPVITLSQLRLNPPVAANPAIGSTVKYTVTGIMSDNSLQDWTALVVYHTGNAGIANWTNPLGTLLGVSAGTANIYVDAVVTINNAPVTRTSPILTVTVPVTPTPPPPTVGGRTFFCATNGNDGVTPGQAQNIATPKKTIPNAQALLAPNDQLLVRGGTYIEPLIDGIASGTSWANKVRVANYPGEPVIVKPTGATFWALKLARGQKYIEYDGIGFDGRTITNPDTVIRLWNNAEPGGADPSFIRIMNAPVTARDSHRNASGNIYCAANDSEFLSLIITGTDGYGLYLGCSRFLVDHCDISRVNSAAVHIYSQVITPINGIVRNSKFHDITQSDFFGSPDNRFYPILSSGNNHQYYNNLIWNNGKVGGNASNAAVFIFSGNGAKIWNSTLVSNIMNGVFITSGLIGVEVRNDIIYQNTGSTIVGTPGTQSNNLTTNPLFVNAAIFDYRIQAGSAARNAGVTIITAPPFPPFTTDIAGTPRPKGAAWDIGAYEFIE